MVSALTMHFCTSLREGTSYMTSSSVSSRTVRRPRAPVLWWIASSAMHSRASGVNDELDVIQGEEALELAQDGVLRLLQDADQRVLAERLEADDERQAADELGDQAVS